jgi:hypothetical protein
MEPKEKKLWDAICLLMLIADSEKARREGRWMTQEQMVKLMREEFGI